MPPRPQKKINSFDLETITHVAVEFLFFKNKNEKKLDQSKFLFIVKKLIHNFVEVLRVHSNYL